jgi:membrane-associated phospholipid phosphatase
VVAYRDLARASGGPRLSFATTARIALFGAGTTVVAATVGGLAVDFWALRRTGKPKTVAARRVLGVGTIEWTVLVSYAWVAACATLILGAHAPMAMSLGWLIAVPACVAGARWVSSPERAQRFTRPPLAQEDGSDGWLPACSGGGAVSRARRSATPSPE